MNDWFQHGEWLGNTALAWVIAALGALAGYAILHTAAALLGARLRKLAERTHRSGLATAADVVNATRGWLLLLIAIAVALDFLHFGRTAEDSVSVQGSLHLLTYALIGIQVAFWASALLVSWLDRSARRENGEPANPVMLGVLTWAAQFVVWVTLVLALLAEGGVNITAFVASLGVGGVAVALALQNVLGDLFASMAIALDKPFAVGDTLELETYIGRVERIGIKTTRLRSVSGEQIILSNADIVKSRVRNYGANEERRALLTLNVDPDTPVEQLREVPAIVERLVGAEPHARFERCHLKTFGDWALQFELSFFTRDPVARPLIDLQQSVHLGLLAELRTRGIKLAVPAQRVLPA